MTPAPWLTKAVAEAPSVAKRLPAGHKRRLEQVIDADATAWVTNVVLSAQHQLIRIAQQFNQAAHEAGRLSAVDHPVIESQQ